MTTETTPKSQVVSSLFTTPDGEEISQKWQPTFIIFAFAVAFVASYAAVHLLDHSLWRTDMEHKHAIITKPLTTAAVLLGFGAVWCMHFIGMAAVTLSDRPICYNWGVTLGSLLVAVAFMIGGLQVASRDIFATPDRVQVLKRILMKRREVTHRKYTKKALREILKVTCLEQLHFIFAGSFLGAAGATFMHYTGMSAMHGAFVIKWRLWIIAASLIYAVVVCFVGFWIMFRLRWKVKDQWLRLVSAAIIPLAVCGLHFGSMSSVRYIADNDSEEVCQKTFDQHNESPNAWTTHQLLVVAIAIAVPVIAVLVENSITQEQLLAHGHNKDKAFTRLIRKMEGSTSSMGSASVDMGSRHSGVHIYGGASDGFSSVVDDNHSVGAGFSMENEIFGPLEDEVEAAPPQRENNKHEDVEEGERNTRSTITEMEDEDEREANNKNNNDKNGDEKNEDGSPMKALEIVDDNNDDVISEIFLQD